jgi:hypothetical protein
LSEVAESDDGGHSTFNDNTNKDFGGSRLFLKSFAITYIIVGLSLEPKPPSPFFSGSWI